MSGSNDFEDCRIVYFDVETTGLHKHAELVQLAAYTEPDEGFNHPAYPEPFKHGYFNSLMLPEGNISPEATKMHGYYMQNRKLHKNGRQIWAESPSSVFQDFSSYLLCPGDPVILVAYGAFSFHAHRLKRAMYEAMCEEEFEISIYGFSDALPLIKDRLKNTGYQGSFSLETLVKKYFPHQDLTHLHDASVDVQLMKNLVDHFGITDKMFKRTAKPSEDIKI